MSMCCDAWGGEIFKRRESSDLYSATNAEVIKVNGCSVNSKLNAE